MERTTYSEEPGAGKELWGLLVEFDNVESLLPAVEKVRDAGFKKWDVHSPLPLHGLDDPMGLDYPKLPWLTLAAGAAGVGAALLLQWYTNAYDYPIVVSGKPIFSLPANIPVTFELAVLFAAVATVGGLFAMNGLPLLYHPLFRKKRFRRVTSDRFFITIEAADPKFDAEATMSFLETLGGSDVERVEV